MSKGGVKKMSTKIICDRCQKDVKGLPSKITFQKDRKVDLCNGCWKGFVKFMGSPTFTKVEKIKKGK